MINKQTLEQTFPLAQALAARGVALNVIQGTPLSDVMATCSTYGLHVEGASFDTLSLDDVANYVVDECGRPLTQDFIPHSSATAKVVEDGAKACSQILAFSKNVVVADINEMLVKTEEAITTIKSARGEPFVIVAEQTPSIYNNPLLHELVQRYEATPARSIERIEIGLMDPAVIRTAVVTGAGSFDTEVAELLELSGGQGYECIKQVFEGAVSLDDIQPNIAIGVHLVSKSLYDNPFEGCKFSLVDYNLLIAKIMEQSGRIVCKEIEQVIRRRQLTSLYNGNAYEASTGKTNILVNNEVYLKLLGEGLTPEALIANELLGRRFNASQLIENCEFLCETYRREMNLRLMQAALEDTNSSREAIERLYAVEIASRDDDTLPVDRGTMQKRARERINLIRQKDLENLPELIRDLTCFIFYAHTDAHQILVSMDLAGALNAEMCPREVVLLVTIAYVASWVAKQMVAA
jgi:hypothetical protein